MAVAKAAKTHQKERLVQRSARPPLLLLLSDAEVVALTAMVVP